MDQTRSILNDYGVISLQVLSDLGRKSLREAIHNGEPEWSLVEVKQLWLRLQWTACSPAVADKHLTAACNAICVFVRCTCQSVHEDVREYGYSEELWFQAFEVVQKAFGDGKNKPALQVLETLVDAAHDNENRDQSRSIFQRAIAKMVGVVLTGQPVIRLKEACTILCCFLRKTNDIVPLAEYFASFDSGLESVLMRRCQQANFSIHRFSALPCRSLGEFLLALLLAASISGSRTAAIKLFSLLCSKTDKVDLSQNVNIASSVIEIFLQANNEALHAFSVDVFPAILNEKEQFHKFLKQFDPAEDFSLSRLSIFLAILQVGRQKGFVTETELPIVVEAAVGDEVPIICSHRLEYVGFQSILLSDVPTIRLQAFNLLTASNATNAPLPCGVLQCLVELFRYLQDDTDVSYRDEYISLSRRLVRRLQRSTQAAQRLGDSATTSMATTFLSNWNSFLYLELSPQVSYQRHILALQLLSQTVSLSMSIEEDIESTQLRKLLVVALLGLVFNAFDDVRSQATSILVSIASYDHQTVATALESLRLIDLGQHMSASSNRADHADALGRLIMLETYVNDLSAPNKDVSKEDTNHGHRGIRRIAKSVEGCLCELPALSPSSVYPVHGNLLAISYIIRLSTSTSAQLDSTTVTGLLGVCTRIWMLVQNEVCVDSPETETEEGEHADYGGPKDQLAYSWRALRDSSLLLQALLDTQAPNYETFQSIGMLCLDQLTKLRHRGAFSTVAQTFALCCSKSRGANIKPHSDPNESWLEVAFDEVEYQAEKLTRRSAGLPSMFAALLDPADPKQFIAGVQRLVNIAQPMPEHSNGVGVDSLRLPQVHALNSLKDVMMNSRFRGITESLVVNMLNLAAQCLGSPIWAIRNCGLMLFRACISRLTPDSSSLYGTHGTRLYGLEANTPLAVAMNLLQARPQEHDGDAGSVVAQSNIKSSEIVFAALDLLGRIPSQPETYGMVDELITTQLGSKLWAVREQAARLKALSVPAGTELASLKFVLLWDPCVSSNVLHGRLLCCRYILQICWTSFEAYAKEEALRQSQALIYEFNKAVVSRRSHPVVLSASLDILNDIFSACLAGGINTDLISECSALVRDVSTKHTDTPEFFLLRRTIALNRAYEYLHRCGTTADHSNSVDVKDYLNSDTMEHDIAIYVTTELTGSFTTACPEGVFFILLEILSACKSTDVQASILVGLSKCMANVCTQTMERVLSCYNMQYAGNRELWNGQICFAATLVRLCVTGGLLLKPGFLETMVDALRTSLQEDSEVLTRLKAAESLAEIAPLLMVPDKATNEQNQLNNLRLLLVLYDFLNDDNEGIRRIASTAASKIFQMHYNVQHVVVRCAAAARETLIQILFSRFENCATFVASAYMKILGATLITGDNENNSIYSFCKNKPVGKTVEDILRRSNDLFAEERQNLYTDDIAEVETWAVAIRQYQCTELDLNTGKILLAWTYEGLQSLLTLLQGGSYKSATKTGLSETQGKNIVHPMGLTYNTEILIVFVRVVTMAGLLRSSQKIREEDTKDFQGNQTTVTDYLRTLQTVCQTCRVHERVLSALECSLRD